MCIRDRIRGEVERGTGSVTSAPDPESASPCHVDPDPGVSGCSTAWQPALNPHTSPRARRAIFSPRRAHDVAMLDDPTLSRHFHRSSRPAQRPVHASMLVSEQVQRGYLPPTRFLAEREAATLLTISGSSLAPAQSDPAQSTVEHDTQIRMGGAVTGRLKPALPCSRST